MSLNTKANPKQTNVRLSKVYIRHRSGWGNFRIFAGARMVGAVVAPPRGTTKLLLANRLVVR